MTNRHVVVRLHYQKSAIGATYLEILLKDFEEILSAKYSLRLRLKFGVFEKKLYIFIILKYFLLL
jgi:hypothetical protein